MVLSTGGEGETRQQREREPDSGGAGCQTEGLNFFPLLAPVGLENETASVGHWFRSSNKDGRREETLEVRKPVPAAPKQSSHSLHDHRYQLPLLVPPLLDLYTGSAWGSLSVSFPS